MSDKSDKSYGADPFIDDLINGMDDLTNDAPFESGADSAKDDDNQAYTEIGDEFDNLMSSEDEITSAEVLKELDSQNDNLSVFDKDLLDMLDHAEIDDNSDYVGFADKPLDNSLDIGVSTLLDSWDEDIPSIEIIDHNDKNSTSDESLNEVNSQNDDSINTDESNLNNEEIVDPLDLTVSSIGDLDNIFDESKDIIVSTVVKVEDSTVSSNSALDYYHNDSNNADDEVSLNANPVELPVNIQDGHTSKVDEGNGLDNSNFFDDIVDISIDEHKHSYVEDPIEVVDVNIVVATNEEDAHPQNIENDHSDHFSNVEDIADFNVPDDDIFDSMSSESDIIDDITDDIPLDPNFDELSISSNLEVVNANKNNNNFGDMYGSGVSGMMSEDNQEEHIEEAQSMPKPKSPNHESSVKAEPIKPPPVSIVDKDLSSSVDEKISISKIRGKIVYGVIFTLLIGLIGLIGFIGLPYVKNFTPYENESVSGEQIASIARQLDDYKILIKNKLSGFASKESIDNRTDEIKQSLSVTISSLSKTEKELRTAIMELSTTQTANKQELESMNRRALQLMDQFIDDTRKSQETLSEQVFSRVMSSVKTEITTKIDPRYIDEIANNVAQNKAENESITRRVQTQMNIINVLESENQFLNKRLLSVEKDNVPSVNKTIVSNDSNSDSQVYLEVSDANGKGVGGYYRPLKKSPAEIEPLYILKGVFENFDGSREPVFYIAPFKAPNSRPVDYRVGEEVPGMGKVLSIKKLNGQHRVPYIVNTTNGNIAGPK